MTEDSRVRFLLEQLLDSRLSPEEVCAEDPALLPRVREGWQRMRELEHEVEALFPTPGSAIGSGDDSGRGPAHASGGGHPRRTPLLPGELPQIAGYGMESVLGRGGMGVVYQARHLRLGRRVALKMLLAGEYAAAEQLARFAREAEVVAGLRHPNIVQVFDVGDHDGRPWFTMELVEGGSLAQKLAGTPQPARAAATMVATLAEAVQVAHAGGVVHRDLKPANILLAADGTPKISDFGLARRLDGGAELTLSGAALGTPSYMAPEQAMGKERFIGPAVDIYALGALLYEMLTGRPPFRGETAAETERQVISEEPARPSRLNAKVPRDLETICLKCLQKDPARRYATAAALADDVHRYLRGEPIAARPVGVIERAFKWMRRRPAQAAALLGGTLLVVGLTGALLWLGLQRASTERAVNEDLADMSRHEQSSAWTAARTALERAKARLGDGGSRALVARAEQGERDLTLVARLDAIRLQRSAVIAGRFEPWVNDRRADADYEVAFREAGWAALGEDAAIAGARIAAGDIRDALVAALDDWAVCASHAADATRRLWVLDVSQRADPDPTGWRHRVRDPATWNDRDALTELARTAQESGTSLPCLVALAQRLDTAGGDGIPLLRRLQREHPGDFWANLTLGDALRPSQPAEAVRFYQAALSIRPDAAVACNNLGHALALAGRVDEAIAQFHDALRLDPTFSHAQFNLGNGYSLAGRTAEAITAYRRAVEMAPGEATAHANLAKVLGEAGQHDAALAEARQAVALDPDLASAHTNAGYMLQLKGHVDEAIAEYRRAIELDAEALDAHVDLGTALTLKGRTDEAIAEFEFVLARDPDLAEAHTGFGNVLRASGRLAEALEHDEQATKLAPGKANTRTGLGNTYAALDRIDDAEREFAEAVRLNPVNATARTNLGNVLGLQNRYEEASVQFREALRLAPDAAQAHASLGAACLNLGRFDEARTALTRGMQLFPATSRQHALCEQQLRLCDEFQALEARLPAVLDGSDLPADREEFSKFVSLARMQRRNVAAARLCANAMAADPALDDDLRAGRRHNGACFAVLAAAGAGTDAADLDDAARADWRAHAQAWLAKDLEALGRLLSADRSKAQPFVVPRLELMQQDADLASVRDESALAALPPAERESWRAFWKAVAELLAEARAAP